MDFLFIQHGHVYSLVRIISVIRWCRLGLEADLVYLWDIKPIHVWTLEEPGRKMTQKNQGMTSCYMSFCNDSRRVSEGWLVLKCAYIVGVGLHKGKVHTTVQLRACLKPWMCWTGTYPRLGTFVGIHWHWQIFAFSQLFSALTLSIRFCSSVLSRNWQSTTVLMVTCVTYIRSAVITTSLFFCVWEAGREQDWLEAKRSLVYPELGDKRI